MQGVAVVEPSGRAALCRLGADMTTNLQVRSDFRRYTVNMLARVLFRARRGTLDAGRWPLEEPFTFTAASMATLMS